MAGHGNLRKPVLVLNGSFEPIRIVIARDALLLLLRGKAHVEVERAGEVYPGIAVPSVIRLSHYHRLPIHRKVLSRRNIMLRDGYQCLYCGGRPKTTQLSLDHIIPRSRGGSNDWDNLCCCCKRCNHRKADRTPLEAGMTLIRRPLPMSIHTSRFVLRTMGAAESEWDRYMFKDSTGAGEFVRHG